MLSMLGILGGIRNTEMVFSGSCSKAIEDPYSND